eukprot:GHVS01029706.1.p1 GENE.GHVS01029706.1~~GHVS01029706.1.p1  ORF type:complete len:1123 (+),score=166.78 GHVS01029706.1:69-3437(+)
MSAPPANDPRILLDTTTPFDEDKVRMLDKVVNAMYSSTDIVSREVAHKVLSDLKSLPVSWTYVSTILSLSSDANTKFFALGILENCILYRWNILPAAEQTGIKQYVSELALTLADNEVACNKEKHFVNKVNENLIQIIKHEWPDKWPTFITELCKSSKAKQSICENNMRLLVLLSEEVFDFGGDQLCSKRLDRLKEEFTAQFSEVFDLCCFIIRSHVQNPAALKHSLLAQTLQCLSHFLKWIPLPFIFETDLIEMLLNNFWDNTSFRIDCVRCLSEVGSLKLSGEETRYLPKLASMWRLLCGKLATLPAESIQYDNTSKVPPTMRLFWETFYAQLAICLTGFLRNHREDVAEVEDVQSVVNCLSLLVKLTNSSHDETFKISLDFWSSFAQTLLQEVHDNYKQQQAPAPLMMDGMAAVSNGGSSILDEPERYSKRLSYYQETLKAVRTALVEKMAKPREVYIQYDQETGEVTREYQVDTDEVALYTTMKDTQYALTKLGQHITKDIMLQQLSAQDITSREDPWNPTALNRLCYSVGSISGAMDEIVERQFLVHVIKNLLSLCEMKRGKENKAVVAANIMYVVGQYPRFLRQHWKFLQTVLLKLFEFMAEEFPGVQKMACETFLKIAQSCKKAMAVRSSTGDDDRPLLHTILAATRAKENVLEDKHAYLVYEAVGWAISASPECERQEYIQQLMQTPNNSWRAITETANLSPDSLFHTNIVKEVTKILNLNQYVARSTGISFSAQLLGLYQHMLTLYGVYSQYVNKRVSENASFMHYQDTKQALTAKRAVLRLVQAFVDTATSADVLGGGEDVAAPTNGGGTAASSAGGCTGERKKMVMELFVCPLLGPLLDDYNKAPLAVRDHEVLALMSTIIRCLDENVCALLPRIFASLFKSTLDMIKADFHSFPDHRANFYDMLMMCNRYSFDGIMSLPQEQLRAFVESLVWAFKHEHPGVAEQGLKITYEFLQRLTTDKTMALLEFCKTFYYSLIVEVLSVMTDTLHKSGFKYQTMILMAMVSIIETGLVNDEASGLTKPLFVNALVEYIVKSFATVRRKQVEAFVVDLFNYSQQGLDRLQTHVRDFLIQIKAFADQNEEQFEAECREALARAEKLEQAKREQANPVTW